MSSQALRGLQKQINELKAQNELIRQFLESAQSTQAGGGTDGG